VSQPLRAGERIILADSRGRRYLIRLDQGATFHWHGGLIRHDDLIGSSDGSRIRAESGAALVAMRPRLADFVLKMARGAQVIYPKDLGHIVMFADVGPGMRVLEAGTGSGALTMALCRAVAPGGEVVSYEQRAEHLAVARTNIETFFGRLPESLDLRQGDVREADGETFDRMMLDLPDPWGALPAAERTLAQGGILCAYLPTTVQVQSLVVGLERAGFAQVETVEVLVRGWHVSTRSVRPDHRMVGHTGFITTARRIAS
jgi:tRNA (adenine57-N1/adenine58-N1)-methyltransferase